MTTPSATTSNETTVLQSNSDGIGSVDIAFEQERRLQWILDNYTGLLLQSYLRLEAQTFKACGLSLMYASSSYSVSRHLLTSDIDSQMPGYHPIQPSSEPYFLRAAILRSSQEFCLTLSSSSCKIYIYASSEQAMPLSQKWCASRFTIIIGMGSQAYTWMIRNGKIGI